MVIQSNQTALVTGASDGIGLELAKLFADHGFNLVIIADNPIKLQQAAKQITNVRNVHIDMIEADLSHRDAPKHVYAAVQKLGLNISILVNNAGVGVYGEFASSDLVDELAMIELNISAVVQLTKFFVNDMIRNQGGKILITSSVAGLSGSPLLTVYGATKAFDFNFAMGLREELKDKNISVTALLPSETDTNFFRRANMENSKIVQGELADPAEVAKAGFDALMAGDAHVAYPFKAKAMHVASHLMPETTKAQMAKKQQEPVA
jgi:short-subunit dehydrogenase